jgi:tRNA(Ile2) C34 agmatinyltransferase TiaS
MENEKAKSQDQTIKCPKCKEAIQPDAKKCKHCGADLRNWFVKHKILTGILILIVILIISSAMSDDSAQTTSETAKDSNTKQATAEEPTKEIAPIKISAAILAQAYVDNEVKADQDYKDKKVEVTGKINDIGVVLNQTFIILSSGKEFSITDIQCFFDDKNEINKISDLKKGDTVTVQGVVDGKSLNVSVIKCVLK